MSLNPQVEDEKKPDSIFRGVGKEMKN